MHILFAVFLWFCFPLLTPCTVHWTNISSICGCWLFWYGLFSMYYILMSTADHIRGVLNDLCPYRSLCRVPCGLDTLLYMFHCCKLDSIPDTGFTALNKIDVDLKNWQVTALWFLLLWRYYLAIWLSDFQHPSFQINTSQFQSTPCVNYSVWSWFSSWIVH